MKPLKDFKNIKSVNLYNADSIKIGEYYKVNSIDCLITDPPYGINYQNHEWDKALPDKAIWVETFKALKPGGFGLVFSSTRLMHRLMVDLEDSGYIIKDVLFWVYLNGMPKSRNIALDIDKELGVKSNIAGKYKYKQGYVKGGLTNYKQDGDKFYYEPTSEEAIKYTGAGLNLKPAYEPIILIQKPIEKGLNVAQNILKYGTGALNIESSRIPYANDDKKVGHNPHPLGRVPSNILRSEDFDDGYDKFFTVAKVRQTKDDFNYHPTIKPVALMEHLVNLISFKDMTILDPFMGSGSTGVACLNLQRKFIGYEISKEYVDIATKRLKEVNDNYEENDNFHKMQAKLIENDKTLNHIPKWDKNRVVPLID
jgi:site-specific DNA-methyltransferase (adenine-specific)